MDDSSAPSPPALTDAETFRLFVASVVDYAIYTLSPEGYVTSWNAGAQRFKGYTEDEIIGRHFSVFYTEEDRADGKPDRAMRIARETGKFEEEGWRVRRDGTRFWASVVLDPIFDADDRLIGYAKITRDITGKREAAEALERAREALFQSQKLEAIGKLTGGVAHDFNNLLAVIVNGIELLASRLQQPADVRVLESMQRAAARGARLNRQLLSFARAQPLQQERNNINQIIGSFEAVLRRVCDESIELQLELAEDLPNVMVDAAQFEAALLNLVSNSRDAIPEGGSITIVTGKMALDAQEVGQLPAGEYVLVCVRDTGTGMSPETVEHSLEPFFTTKPVGEGTGMGLSQTYGLMQQSGGDLVIRSVPGRGTTICLYLPACPAQEDDAEVERDPGAECALVVDDEPDVLAMAVELFQAMGYEVLSANNGEDALDILRRRADIGVLFTDVVMPGINGIALGKEALKINPDIKVLLASGYPGATLRESEQDLNHFRLIQKPYRMAQILRMLRESA